MNRTNLIRDLFCIAAGAAAGAAAMYWLDPAQGGERRAALRASGPGRAAGSRRLRAAQQDDATLRERVRLRLGALVSHPGAIDVRVEQSIVRLSGHVLAKELDGLLFRVRDVAGVHRVVNALTAHHAPEDLVAAQDGSSLERRRVQPA
ncbi:MAG: BON domain-containing protein [Pseudomonadota bacterium]